jgi:hypothetical protein
MAAMIVLAVLVFASVSVVAAVAATFRFPSRITSFRCKIRPAPLPGAKRHRWPLRRCRATWVHDVLMVRRGLVLATVSALPVHLLEKALRETGPDEIPFLGPALVAVVLRLDDDSLVEVAAASGDRTALVGPFLAAAIPGLPSGPSEPKKLRRW